MAFNLWTDGERAADRFARFNKKTVARDPLSGVVDSVNQYFYANYYPILTSGSVGLYTSGSVSLASNQWTLDYDAGLFTLTTAPAVQPSATYQTANYPEMVMRSFLVAGFDEMEGQWFRGLALSEAVGNVVIPITEDSAAAYITDSSGSNPTIGAIHFDDSRAQINLYVKCVQLTFYRTLMGDHALSDYVWQEAQGLRVDKSRNVPNLKLALDATEKAVQQALKAAQYEWYGTAVFGGAVLSPHTKEFVAHNFWQQKSISENWRGTTTYTGDRW